MGARTWTADRLDQLRALWAEGRNAADIATIMGVTKSSVKNNIVRHGFKKDDLTKPRKLSSSTRTWLPDRIEQLRKLWVDEKKTGAEIAEIMGVKKTVVFWRVEQYGFKKELPPRVPKPKPPKVKKEHVEPAWRNEARTLRAAGHSISDIMTRVGCSKSMVRAACSGVACPVDHGRETRLCNMKAASERRASLPKKPRAAQAPRTRKYVPGMKPAIDPALARMDRLKRQIRAAIGKADATREIPPVTLPKLRFLEAT